MEELGKWLIALDGEQVGVVGLLLVFIVATGWALNTERIVTGPRFRGVVADRDKATTALTAAQVELQASREAHTDARIVIARLETERDLGWPDPPPRRRSGEKRS